MARRLLAIVGLLVALVLGLSNLSLLPAGAVNQVSKSFPGFKPGVSTLNQAQRSALNSFLALNESRLESATCTGFYAKIADAKVAKARALAACRHLNMQAPGVNALSKATLTANKSALNTVSVVLKLTTLVVSSPSPTPEQTVKTIDQIVRENCGQVNGVIEGPLRAVCAVEHEKIGSTAFNDLVDRAKLPRPSSAQVTLVLSASLEPERAKFASLISRALAFYGPDLKSDNLYISIFTPNEVDIAEKAFDEISVFDGPLAQWNMVRTQGEFGCGGQAISRVDPKSGKFKSFFVACIDIKKTTVEGVGPIIAHETYHIVQGSNYKTLFHGFPVTNLPHWLSEGSATLFSEALQEGTRPVWYSHGWPNIPELQEAVRAGQATKIIQLYRSLEPTEIGGPGASSKSYFLGGLASEVLVATFGYQKLRDFSDLFAESSDIQKNFRSVYGFNLDDFYSRMASYLQWWVLNELGR